MVTTIRKIDVANYNDIIDIRDVIARFEEIEHSDDTDDKVEADKLAKLLEECRGNGGDEEWRGDWYPVTLIKYSYFVEYAKQLADDIGAIDLNAKWPCNCIDWDKAAIELQADYTLIDYDGEYYWTR